MAWGRLKSFYNDFVPFTTCRSSSRIIHPINYTTRIWPMRLLKGNFASCNILVISSFRRLIARGYIYIYIHIYIYIYIYIKWTVFVNVTTKSARHAHLYIYIHIYDVTISITQLCFQENDSGVFWKIYLNLIAFPCASRANGRGFAPLRYAPMAWMDPPPDSCSFRVLPKALTRISIATYG